MSTVISQVAAPVAEKPIDREKICPLLLRIFCNNGRHNPMSDYTPRGGVPANELQVYTWMDCSLRELMSLIKEVNPDARRKGTQFEFTIISPSRNGPRFESKEMGGVTAGIRGSSDAKTLGQLKYDIGDYIDCAITLPMMGGRRFGGDRFGGDRGGFGDRNGGFGAPRGNFRDRSPRRDF